MPQSGEETQEVELSVVGFKVINFQHKGFREPGLIYTELWAVGVFHIIYTE